MNATLLQVIRVTNPWLEDPKALATWARRMPGWIERILPAADRWPLPGKAHMLLGARQVGKSSWLRHRLAASPSPPLLLNAEELSVQTWARSAALALADLRRLMPPDAPVILEEAQHLQEAGLFLKGLIDGGLSNPLYVTGSSAWHLHARTRESLAGRAARVFVHPLGLHELAPRGLPPLLREAKARELAMQAAVTGGYPEVVTGSDRAATLSALLEAFVIRDASDLFRIKHLEAFRRLLLLVAGQVGSLVNASEWAGHCGISRDTVEHYLDILVESHILHRVAPFAGGKRAEVTHQPKVYFCDNGILNAVSLRFEPFAERVDRGPLWESLVGAELRKHLDPLHPFGVLRYWRSTSRAEVDFVIEREDGLWGVECKASAMPRPALTRSARSFIDAYGPRRFVVANLGLHHDEIVGETRVSWRGPEWLVTPFEPGM